MTELIVNDQIEYSNLKQWLVIDNKTVIDNYHSVFGEKGVTNLKKAVLIYGSNDFYDIRRMCQFVGIIKYSSYMQMFTMSLFESNSMDNFLDAFGILTKKDWQPSQLEKVGSIMQEIIEDKNKELASVVLQKLL